MHKISVNYHHCNYIINGSNSQLVGACTATIKLRPSHKSNSYI